MRKLKKVQIKDRYNVFSEDIEEVVRMKVHKGVFAYYDLDDAAQEIRIMCLDALTRYDSKIGPIKNFLLRHVQNRQYNLKRDIYFRCDNPCRQKKCRYYVSSGNDCRKDRDSCELWQRHISNIHTRINIMNPIDINSVSSDYDVTSQTRQIKANPVLFNGRNIVSDELLDEVYTTELDEKIRGYLPDNLVSTYVDIISGKKYQPKKAAQVRRLIKKLLEKLNG